MKSFLGLLQYFFFTKKKLEVSDKEKKRDKGTIEFLILTKWQSGEERRTKEIDEKIERGVKYHSVFEIGLARESEKKETSLGYSFIAYTYAHRLIGIHSLCLRP